MVCIQMELNCGLGLFYKNALKLKKCFSSKKFYFLTKLSSHVREKNTSSEFYCECFFWYLILPPSLLTFTILFLDKVKINKLNLTNHEISSALFYFSIFIDYLVFIYTTWPNLTSRRRRTMKRRRRHEEEKTNLLNFRMGRKHFRVEVLEGNSNKTLFLFGEHSKMILSWFRLWRDQNLLIKGFLHCLKSPTSFRLLFSLKTLK